MAGVRSESPNTTWQPQHSGDNLDVLPPPPQIPPLQEFISRGTSPSSSTPSSPSFGLLGGQSAQCMNCLCHHDPVAAAAAAMVVSEGLRRPTSPIETGFIRESGLPNGLTDGLSGGFVRWSGCSSSGGSGFRPMPVQAEMRAGFAWGQPAPGTCPVNPFFSGPQSTFLNAPPPNMPLRRPKYVRNYLIWAFVMASKTSIFIAVCFSLQKIKFTFCVFCKNNGEDESYYLSHTLKDDDGRVVCPILSNYTCPICLATGPVAHTIKYCPQNKVKESM